MEYGVRNNATGEVLGHFIYKPDAFLFMCALEQAYDVGFYDGILYEIVEL